MGEREGEGMEKRKRRGDSGERISRENKKEERREKAKRENGMGRSPQF